MRLLHRKKHILKALSLITLAGFANAEETVGLDEFTLEGLSLEEILVTAQKRMQTAQQVPVTMSTFDEALIKDLGMTKITDIASHIPNFDISYAFGNSSPILTLRGLGINDVNSNNNPSAGVYMDDVYLGSTAMIGATLFDVQRVEVLFGPQGTLYGRNTTSGAISFFSNMPTEALEARIEVTKGNYGLEQVEGAISSALGTDKVLGRFAFKKHHQGGHYNNVTLGDSAYGDTEIKAYRGTLMLLPTDDLALTLSFHDSRDESEGWLFTSVIDPNGERGTGAAGFNDTDGDPFRVYSELVSPNYNDTAGGYFKVEYALEDWEITSITAHETVDRLNADDTDGTPNHIYHQFFKDDIEQFSQEFRSVYSGDMIELILGAFYSKDTVDGGKHVVTGSGAAITTDYEQISDSKSVFAHSEWELNDEWNIIAGMRYTKESKDFEVIGNYPGFVSGFVDPDLHEFRNLDEDDTSGTLGFRYAPESLDNVMFYSTVSKGFKSGGFDGSTLTEPVGADPFIAETVYAFEAGVKSSFLDDSMRLNASIFIYDYRDMQLNTVTDDGSSVLTNAGEADIKGFDGTWRWKVSHHWEFQIAIGYVDGEIADYTTTETGDNDYTGNDVPNAPTWSSNAYVRYNRMIGNFEFFTVVNADHMSSTYKTIQNNEFLRSDSRTLTNLTIGLVSPSGDWEVSAWGKNVFDKEYVVYGYDRTSSTLGDAYTQLYGMPATYGVTFEYFFGK